MLTVHPDFDCLTDKPGAGRVYSKGGSGVGTVAALSPRSDVCSVSLV
jgi:hypothetical protein